VNHRWPVKKTFSSGRGVVKSTPYVINPFEPALAHRFWNEKSRANDPMCMARDLHSYLGGIAEIVGGVTHHVHLLAGLRATHRLAHVLRELKSVSSGWVHDEIGMRGFAWQEGYGAFPVSPSQRDALRHYIERQDEHHRTRTFREEYLELLRRNGVEFDESYV
jgi:REP-associated tyrosine transposase